MRVRGKNQNKMHENNLKHIKVQTCIRVGKRIMYLIFKRNYGSDAHRPALFSRRKKLDLEKVSKEKWILCGYLEK